MWRLRLRMGLFESDYYPNVILILVLSLIFTISLYGTVDSEAERYLDQIAIIFAGVFALEFVLKVIAFTPTEVCDDFTNFMPPPTTL